MSPEGGKKELEEIKELSKEIMKNIEDLTKNKNPKIVYHTLSIIVVMTGIMYGLTEKNQKELFDLWLEHGKDVENKINKKG